MLWDKKKRAGVQQVIEVLLPQTRGAALIQTPKNQLAMLELVLSSNQPNRLSLHALSVLNEMNTNDLTTIEDFERIFKERFNAQIKNIKTYHIFVPFSFNNDYVKPRYRFDGLTMIPCEKEQLPKYVYKSSKYDQLSDIKFSNRYFFLKVNLKSSSSYEAFSQILSYIAKFRGLLEFSIGKYTTRAFSTQQQPLRQLSEPPFVIVIANKSDWTIYEFDIDETFNNKYSNITQDQMERFHKNLNFFANRPKTKSTNNLILNSMVLYIKALDARFNYEIFLSFWQLAEILMNSDLFGGKSKTMADRLKYFATKLSTYTVGLDYSIDALAEKRNSIVHAGQTSVLNEEIKLVKIICDLMIGWMIGISNNLSSINHLDDYFKFKDCNNTRLSTLQSTLDFIEKERK